MVFKNAKIKCYFGLIVLMNIQKKSLKNRYLALITLLLLSGGIGWVAKSATSKDIEYKDEKVVQELTLPPFSSDYIPVSYWYDEEVQTGDDLGLVLQRLGGNEHSIKMVSGC